MICGPYVSLSVCDLNLKIVLNVIKIEICECGRLNRIFCERTASPLNKSQNENV